jgi:NitT/TauT family transport system ATP-binding protein
MPVDEKNKMILKLENISQGFIVKDDVKQVVDNVSMEVRDNEFLVVLGPGHCGKTVLMNIIAGLDKAVSGKVYLDGEEIHGSDSRIGMVFQSLNLMPWRTVMGNVEFGLEISGQNKATRRANAQKYIDLVGLTGFENSYPHQLSGGMKQRVGIARAYTNSPEIMLMDEPFGQLDAQTRYAMQEEVLRIWESEKRTIIFVTNNIEEAVYLADRVILLSNCPAKVKQIYDLSGLKRPRNFTDPEFLRIRKDISDNTDLAL